jgi:hypothetical protein
MDKAPGKSPDSLINIIQDINEAANIDSQQLIEIIKKAGPVNEDFLPFSEFDHALDQSYGRNNIYQGPNYSIYIMSWAPGDFTAIHSHGASLWGAVYFFDNTSHRLYKAEGHKIELRSSAGVPGGTIAPVNGNLVHAMGNLGNKPIMTLHIYGWDKQGSNANDNSLVYELEKKQVRTTNGAAFLNISDELCKKSEKGIITNDETLRDYLEIVLPFYRKNKNQAMIEKIEQFLHKPELYQLS